MARPTPKEIVEAREKVTALLNCVTRDPDVSQYVDGTEAMALQTLLAATEPPTDNEIVERYNAFLKRKDFEDRGHAIWFADGVEAFIGRKRETRQCVCGKCPVKP